MPPQTTTSGLLKKLAPGIRNAFREKKDEEFEIDLGVIPEGVEDGIAQILTIRIAPIEKEGDFKGVPMFFMRFQAVEPESIVLKGRVIGVRGKAANDSIILAAGQYATEEEVTDKLLAKLKSLGLIDFSELSDLDDVIPVLEQLTEDKPFVKFRSFKSNPTKDYPDPKTQYRFMGPATDYEPEDNPEDHVEVEAEKPAAKNGKPAATAAAKTTPTPAKTAAAPPKAGPKPGPKKAAPEPEPEPEEEVDLAALVAAASDEKNPDKNAHAKLTELAVAAGRTETDVEGAKDWAEVARMIDPEFGTAEEAGEAAEETVEDQWVPAVKDVYLFRPIDPKTKKPAKKGIEVEVTKADAKKRTVDLLNNDDRKTKYSGVSWDALEEAGG